MIPPDRGTGVPSFETRRARISNHIAVETRRFQRRISRLIFVTMKTFYATVVLFFAQWIVFPISGISYGDHGRTLKSTADDIGPLRCGFA